MSERIAQPRRRAGWVTGQEWSGREIRLNLAHIVAIKSIERAKCLSPGESPVKVPTLQFDVPDGGEDGSVYELLRTEDLLRQLHEGGL